eukprot:5300915-Pyramimonas_sp.AAC.1
MATMHWAGASAILTDVAVASLARSREPKWQVYMWRSSTRPTVEVETCAHAQSRLQHAGPVNPRHYRAKLD